MLITHDVVEAAMLADRVLVLRDGRSAWTFPSTPDARASPTIPRCCAWSAACWRRCELVMDGTDLRWFVERLRPTTPEPRLPWAERRRLFLEPRCHGTWLPQDVPDDLIEEALYPRPHGADQRQWQPVAPRAAAPRR